MAFVTTVEDTTVFGMLDLATEERSPVVAFPDADFQIAWLEWANEGRILFGADIPFSGAMRVRARSHLLFGVDRDGENLRHLGSRWFGRSGNRSKPEPEALRLVPIQYEDHVVAWLRDDPRHVLLSLRPPNRRAGEGVYELDVHTGDLDEVVPARGTIAEWYANRNGAVRMGVGVDHTQMTVVARARDDQLFEPVASYHVTEGTAFKPLGLSSKPSVALVSSAHETGRAAVYEYDLEHRRFVRRLFGHPEVDIGGLIHSRQKNEYVGVVYAVDRPQSYYWDADAGKEQADIDRALPGRFNRIVSRSADGRLALVRSSSDVVPPTTYLYDRDKRAMGELFDDYPGLRDVELAPTRAFTYEARDGLEIPAYLTLPNSGGKAKLPLIVYPHGGPWARDYIDFDPVVQLFASRGYGILQINFRGSTGYGAKFTALGHQKLGMEMQDDLTDGVRYLIAKGIADPKRIGVYGASYGGYAALMGAATTPDLFLCAASYAGVSDLDALIDESRWYQA